MINYTSYTINNNTISLNDTMTINDGEILIRHIFRFKNDMMIVYSHSNVGELVVEKMDKFFDEKLNYFNTIKNYVPEINKAGDCSCCGKNE